MAKSYWQRDQASRRRQPDAGRAPRRQAGQELTEEFHAINQGQYDIWHSKADVLAAVAGHGGGKSQLGAYWLLNQVKKHPGEAFIVAGPTYNTLEKSSIPKLKGILALHGLPWDYDQTEKIGFRVQQKQYMLPNGGIIYFVSSDKPGSMQGAHCLYGDQRVLLADGTSKSIRRLVKESYSGEVMSLASDGSLQPARVVNWFENDLGARHWLKVTTEVSGQVWATNDHRFLTPDGWVRADALTEGTPIATAYRALGTRQRAVLLGSLLGDGSLFGKRLPVFREQHGSAQRDYLGLKATIFSPSFGGKIKQVRAYARSPKGGVYYVSHAQAAFLEIRREWYVDGVKRVPVSLAASDLTDLALAVWYMDDGRLDKRGKQSAAQFCTNGFTSDEVGHLVTCLGQVGVPARKYMTRQGTQPIIHLGPDGVDVLFSRITQFIPSSMRHKVPMRFHSIPFASDAWEPEDGGVYFAQSTISGVEDGAPRNILSPLRGDQKYNKHKVRGLRRAYCIEVEGHHNFITSDVVVSNCRAFWMDEVVDTDYYAFETLYGRVAFKSGQGLITSTPYDMGWFYAQVWQRWIADGRPSAGKAKSIFCAQWKSIDNKFFPKDRYAALQRSMEPWRFRLLYEGEFERPMGLVYDCFSPDTWIDPFEIPADWPRKCGLDFGIVDPTACLWMAQGPDKMWYAYDEYYQSGWMRFANGVDMESAQGKHSTQMELIDEVIAKCVDRKERPKVYCDDSGKDYIMQTKDKFEDALGLTTVWPAHKRDISSGIQRCYGLVRSGGFRAFNTLKHFRDEVEGYSYQIDKDTGELAKGAAPKDNNNHLMDAWRYAVVGSPEEKFNSFGFRKLDPFDDFRYPGSRR